jgi:hypothetical protein
VNHVPRWRIAAAWAVLALLGVFSAAFAPIYLHNLELQQYVLEITQSVENQAKPDDILTGLVLRKAHELDLPVKADNVRIVRSPDKLRIDVRYFVRATLPGYTVDLHFYPGAGSK